MSLPRSSLILPAATVRLSKRTPELSLDELEKRLVQRAASPQDMRALYAMAYREVAALIRREGETGVWRRLVVG